jgi:hypothetical protein
LKAVPPVLCNVLAVKTKQKVLGFILKDKTIYAWFCKALELLSSPISSSLLKKKFQNNFGHIQHKERQVKAQDGKSQRIASNSLTAKAKSKPRKAKKGTPPAAAPPSISSISRIESNSYRRYLIEDFLYASVGNQLLLQITMDHQYFASY